MGMVGLQVYRHSGHAGMRACGCVSVGCVVGGHADGHACVLASEVAAGRMSGPFSLAEATIIFGTFLLLFPGGPSQEITGDNIWHMIWHLSMKMANPLMTGWTQMTFQPPTSLHLGLHNL